MTAFDLALSPLRHWSAWVPIAIPLFLVALGLRHVVLYGLVRQADEGTEAHLFQLLMPVQLVAVAWFGATWLSRAPRRASAVLAIQVALTLAEAGERSHRGSAAATRAGRRNALLTAR